MNDSIATFILWIKRHKYWFVTIAFLVIIVFFDENNMIKHFRNQREIAALKAENEQLQQQLDELSHKLEELYKTPEITEKVAREKYGMHKDGEEIFIIEE